MKPLVNSIATGLARELGVPLHRQLYQEIRDGVLQSRLKGGLRLPSSRVLASELRLSRNTVLAAYDQLVAEGYLVMRRGSGAYVAEVVPGFRRIKADSGRSSGGGGLSASSRGKRLRQLAPLLPPPNPIPFRHGFPALDEFPKKTWARLVGKHWRSVTKTGLGYGS